MTDGYAFPGLPLNEMRPGTSVLVAGPTHAGTVDLALRMLAGGENEGTIVVTTNRRAERVVEDCGRAGVALDRDRTAILDCVGGEEDGLETRVLPVGGPSDLTGIGMRFSDVFADFHRSGFRRVRTGLISVSTLLSFGALQAVSRFVHTVVGRIDRVDGLGVFVVDAPTHDEKTVGTLAQFCAGTIEVREGEAGPELRPRGLPDQSRDWRPFDRVPGGPDGEAGVGAGVDVDARSRD